MRTQSICLALAIVLLCPFASAQWLQQNSGTTHGLYAVSFSDANNGTVVGDSGTILRTRNAGATWTSQTSGTTSILFGVSFTDAEYGTVVGDSGTILHTTNGGVTSVGGEHNGVPHQYSLSQNYPNPLNPSTTIKFELPKASLVSLTVYDILGRVVSVLVNEGRGAGVHEVKFDGSSLASGVYFYRLQAENFTQTKRLLLLK
jgi:hypothetical protein